MSMSVNDDTIFIIDTSVIIYMDRYYGSYTELWERLDSAVKEGLIELVSKVRDELLPSDEPEGEFDEDSWQWDYAAQWAEQRESSFIKTTEEEWGIVKEILSKKDERQALLKDYSLGADSEADPFLVARAVYHKRRGQRVVVVTGETKRIPYVCKKRGIEAIGMEEFIERVGWEFN